MWNDKAMILLENGDDCMRVGRYEQALSLYDKAMEEDTGELKIHILNNKGEAYIAMGDFEEARKYFEQTMEIDPQDAGSYSGFGAICYHEGRKKEALEYFLKAKELSTLDEIIPEWIEKIQNEL